VSLLLGSLPNAHNLREWLAGVGDSGVSVLGFLIKAIVFFITGHGKEESESLPPNNLRDLISYVYMVSHLFPFLVIVIFPSVCRIWSTKSSISGVLA
jgi:hypothetical protein